MKYNNTHHHLPDPGQPVYFIGPTAKETLGIFLGGQLFFQSIDKTLGGYYSKWWRALTEEELRLVPKKDLKITFVDSREPMKRGRKPKVQ